jgi:tetratricopeptide (TPR) repeat protein
MNSLGNLFQEHEDWNTARQYYRQVLEFNRDPRSKSMANYGLSYIFEKHEKNLELAIKHMKLATELIKRTNRKDILKKSKERLLKLERQHLSNNKS